MGTQYRKTITVEVQFTARELKAIRRFYGYQDGNDASTSQVQQFVKDEIAQSKRQVLDDYFVAGGKSTPTFSGRDIAWKGDGYYRYDSSKETYLWVNPSSVRGFEKAGVKVVCLQDADISR